MWVLIAVDHLLLIRFLFWFAWVREQVFLLSSVDWLWWFVLLHHCYLLSGGGVHLLGFFFVGGYWVFLHFFLFLHLVHFLLLPWRRHRHITLMRISLRRTLILLLLKPIISSIISSPCHKLLIMQILRSPIPKPLKNLIHRLILPLC